MAEKKRPRGSMRMSPEKIAEATTMYLSGVSLREVASCFGVTYTPMRAQLVAAGVEMRQSRGENCPLWRGGPTADQRARQAVQHAVNAGRLIKPAACSACGAGGRIEGHHDDYNYPLTVRWLCSRCHRAWHETSVAIPNRAPVPMPEPVAYSPEQRAEIARLRALGLTNTQIAKRVGGRHGTVATALRVIEKETSHV